MKPHVICHMLSSVDGRILGSRWRPKGTDTAGLFERLHDQLEGDAWIVGRVTGQQAVAKGDLVPGEAATLAGIVDRWRAAYETTEMDRRLSALEEKAGG